MSEQSIGPVMEPHERKAFEWALNQNCASVAAEYARTLAQFILRINAAQQAAAADRAELIAALQVHAEFFRSQKMIATSADRLHRFRQLEADARALIAKHTPAQPEE